MTKPDPLTDPFLTAPPTAPRPRPERPAGHPDDDRAHRAPSPTGGAVARSPRSTPPRDRAPQSVLDRCVCWCRTCLTHVNDDPGWAEQHHTETGHQTHRRQWRVQTWGTP